MDAVLEDWRTAPIDDRVKATLAFLEKLTLHPTGVNAADAASVLAAGVSPAALRDAIYVCVLFNTIDRIADALGVEALSEDKAERGAQFILDQGYDHEP